MKLRIQSSLNLEQDKTQKPMPGGIIKISKEMK
jgi:hypothetical protein